MMKSVSQKATSVLLSLMLAVPTGGFAQQALSQCKAQGRDNRFPCRVDRVIVHSAAELELALVDRKAREVLNGRSVGRCGDEKTQVEFPCELRVGGYAYNQRALREVRRRFERARAQATQRDKRLTPEQFAEIVEATPGVLPHLQKTTAAPKAKPVRRRRANLPNCGPTEQQLDYPCRLVVGGIAQDAIALRTVRAFVNNARRNVRAQGRNLTPEEVAQIVATTPGITVEREAPQRVPRSERAVAAGQGGVASGAITEAITTGRVRRSDEEFDTAVGTIGQDSGGGLSKFEQTLLLGLGGVVVGSVLRNGDRIVSRTGDRVVVLTPQGELRVLKDDDALVRRPGDRVQTQTFNDGSTRTIIRKQDGTQVITIRGRDGAVLRRTNVDRSGREFVLFDDTLQEQQVVVSQLPPVQTPSLLASEQNDNTLRQLLATRLAQGQQKYSLRQVREIPQVRALVPELELDAVRFQTGSAAIRPEQARALTRIGTMLRDLIARDPSTVILVEGHTDAVGDATYNLALSDRRAETLALALTEYFQVPPGNLVTQGYGESALKVPSLTSEAANRRAVVRNITGILR